MEYFKQINLLYWNGSKLEYIYYICIIIILVFEKRKTYKIVFGVFSILFLLGLASPIAVTVAKVLFNGSGQYFVRLFSVIPVFYCMAHGIIILLNRLQRHIKFIGICAVVILIMFIGNNIYKEPWMKYANNIYKTPDEVFSVLKAIPRGKKNVRVAFPDPLYCYARQIDGNIQMPYGRDLGAGRYKLLEEISSSSPNPENVMRMAANTSVDYVVVKNNEDIIKAFSDYEYVPIAETDAYCIYSVTAPNKTEYYLNDKRQIEIITECDKNGNPVYSNNRVMTTIEYSYDRWGNPVKEMYYDKSGKHVTNIEGNSGIKKTYQLNGLQWVVNSITYLDENEQPTQISGRYETRYEYNKNRQITKESYFDKDGRPMNRTDTGYSNAIKRYDSFGRIVMECYTDIFGNKTESNDGYAEYTCDYENNRIVSEKYYDVEGSEKNNKYGFAEWNRMYDDLGNVIKETFINDAGKEVDMNEYLQEYYSDNLLDLIKKRDIENGVGIKYIWNDDGSCMVTGESQGISWYDIVNGEKPFCFINGETYHIKYSAENVVLVIGFYEDSSLSKAVGEFGVNTLEETDFTVPENCGAIVIRLWVAPGTRINETIQPVITVASSEK